MTWGGWNSTPSSRVFVNQPSLKIFLYFRGVVNQPPWSHDCDKFCKKIRLHFVCESQGLSIEYVTLEWGSRSEKVWEFMTGGGGGEKWSKKRDILYGQPTVRLRQILKKNSPAAGFRHFCVSISFRISLVNYLGATVTNVIKISPAAGFRHSCISVAFRISLVIWIYFCAIVTNALRKIACGGL